MKSEYLCQLFFASKHVYANKRLRISNEILWLFCFFTDPLFLMKTATVAKKRRDECLERPTKLQKPNYFLNNETLAGKLSCKLLTLEPHLKHRITLV